MARMSEKGQYSSKWHFLTHFCHFLRLRNLYLILVFNSHLVWPKHNFYTHIAYIYEKKIFHELREGGAFDFNTHEYQSNLSNMSNSAEILW